MNKILNVAIVLLFIAILGYMCRVEEFDYNYAIITVGDETREIELLSWTTTGIDNTSYWLVDKEGNKYLANEKNCVLVQKVEELAE